MDGSSSIICQLESVSDPVDKSEDETNVEYPSPWHEQYTKEVEPRAQILRRINTNNRVAISAKMPIVSATNTRSIFPKIKYFAEVIIQRQIMACFVYET